MLRRSSNNPHPDSYEATGVLQRQQSTAAPRESVMTVIGGGCVFPVPYYLLLWLLGETTRRGFKGVATRTVPLSITQISLDTEGIVANLVLHITIYLFASDLNIPEGICS